MKQCPVCTTFLDEVTKSGILIDVCPKCKGVWLDRGELNQLLERARAEQAEYESYYERRHSDHDHHHYDKHHYGHGDHYKKKSLFRTLQDIFD
ncbi:zf-TFIIB domain-containing protein [Pelotomaculum propionicicum]|uniref:Transcription factor zinc-finger domain-containing protein n=1 Tax=Pelotomaculum propionicicum TaxID=258475 RepID=A0A4Y7RL19_9FIRM|nr:zf-TFIIB domain-containing protein [Pelotomaculum propionicicum]NLI12455.1 hypothetical protein [Peptococcaceae bacterium]TEB09501.1 hypothetical protein Pmgp_03104 [Pelotomaculum propionicicum]